MILSLIAANTAGHTKKSLTAGLIWAAYSSANGVAPLLVRTQEQKDHYPTAFIAVIVMMSLTFTLLGIHRICIFMINRRRDDESPVDLDTAALTGFLDLTDRENKNFRYQA